MNNLNINNIKVPSNKNFGITFFFVFVILSIIFLFKSTLLFAIFFFISLIFLFLGLKNYLILSPLNKLWFKFGLLLGKIVSPIIIGIIFFFVITPIGFLMKKIFSKNLLYLKKNTKSETYWKYRKEKNYNMKNQF